MPGLASGLSVNGLVAPALPLRHYDYQCRSVGVVEDITVELPPSLTILAMPKDVHWQSSGSGFDMVYQRVASHTVQSRRAFRFDQSDHHCTADLYNSVRPQWLKLRGAMRAQVIYE
jgi:hypothetical protein